jgi:hypothetical protein
VTPENLSLRLRRGRDLFLERRRGMVSLSLAGMGSLGVIALYQMGIITHLPDPPLPGFDADKVHGSAKAYALLAAPDGALGLGSYAGTAILATIGGPDRAVEEPWIPLLLAGKIAFDVLQAARLSWNEVAEQHALSVWSLCTVAATGTTAVLVVPEARAALRCLAHHTKDESSQRVGSRSIQGTAGKSPMPARSRDTHRGRGDSRVIRIHDEHAWR